MQARHADPDTGFYPGPSPPVHGGRRMTASALSLRDRLAVEPGCALPVWSVPPQALGPVEASARAEVSALQFAVPAASLHIAAAREWPCWPPAQSSPPARGE